MNSKALYILSFMIGAAVGAAVTVKYIKNKYVDDSYFENTEQPDEKEGDNSDDSVNVMDTVHVMAEQARQKRDITEYASKIKKEKYNTEEVTDVEDYKTVETPYIISPEDFGEYGYETISLTYYSDEVLTDDEDNIIDDPDEIVGKDYASHFGEYEDDSVFVRNDTKRCDYEILRDYRKYTDVADDT